MSEFLRFLFPLLVGKNSLGFWSKIESVIFAHSEHLRKEYLMRENLKEIGCGNDQ